VHTLTRRTRLVGDRSANGLGTIAIGSAVSDTHVTIVYEIPGPVSATTSRGSTLDQEPASPGTLMIDEELSACHETDLPLAGLAAGDHLYTVAATVDGRIVTGSTIFTIPAA
jgi:hypothetical protein